MANPLDVSFIVTHIMLVYVVIVLVVAVILHIIADTKE
jgi:ABC-type uncharacterized transport system permease subunit